jgi:hypothetical protein
VSGGERERWIQFEILKAWGSSPRLRLWRANVGVGWFANGEPARKTDPGAYPVKFGVEGQGDLSGLIDGDADGVNRGRRLEIECKTERGKQSDAQKRFQAMIERFGGLYVLARSVEDVDQALARVGITR